MVQFKRIKNQRDVQEKRKSSWLCMSSFFFCLVFLCGCFGLGYIFQVNKVAVMGYEIKNREEELKRIEEENNNLKIALASQQSIYLLEEKKDELGMVSPEVAGFLEINTEDKLVMAK